MIEYALAASSILNPLTLITGSIRPLLHAIPVALCTNPLPEVSGTGTELVDGSFDALILLTPDALIELWNILVQLYQIEVFRARDLNINSGFRFADNCTSEQSLDFDDLVHIQL